MNRIKTIIIGTIALIVLAVVILGPQKVESHVFAGRERIKEKVDDVSSDAQELARARYLLNEYTRETFVFEDDLVDVQLEISEGEKEVNRLQSQLSDKHKILARLKDFLAKDAMQYTIDGNVYTREQLEQDALFQVGEAQAIEEDLQAQIASVDTMSKGLKEGEAGLKMAQRARDKAGAEVAEIERRLKNARMLGKAQVIADRIAASSFGPRSELADTLDNLRKRYRLVERENKVRATGVRSGSVIDWGTESKTSALKAVEDYLGNVGDAPDGSSSIVSPPETTVDLSRALSGEAH